ncbi:MAG: formylglycine-generating enzyme family protein [Spirochaetes bacterium]|nr:formylglycine-generating enzyme family protein [Spirochaetota bacterium]MBU0954358.1 formylglycine-generating enzyme family protein [Spirochaetota bacterium]
MTPVSTIETSQYSGTVSWSLAPSGGVFVVDEAYTATISLTRKHGYTFEGIAADTCTVAGAETVTHPEGSNNLTVTADYPATGRHYYSSNIGILRYVPAGSFQRDSDPVNISIITQPYRMGQHEITRAQFLAVMGTDSSDPYLSSGTSDPVQRVNWYHAIAFCNKLSLAEGLTPVYSVSVGGIPIDWDALTYDQIPTADNADWNGAVAAWANNGNRLPTEMEWMWAAMGATEDRSNGYTRTGVNTTGYSKAFAGSTGSNAIGDYAVFGYYGSETGKTTTERSNPVGSKTTGDNELGLYDMSGNVYEWTFDWFAGYHSGTQTDYSGAALGSTRVMHGGSWGNYATDYFVAYRDYILNPYGQYVMLGFRVIRP